MSVHEVPSSARAPGTTGFPPPRPHAPKRPWLRSRPLAQLLDWPVLIRPERREERPAFIREPGDRGRSGGPAGVGTLPAGRVAPLEGTGGADARTAHSLPKRGSPSMVRPSLPYSPLGIHCPRPTQGHWLTWEEGRKKGLQKRRGSFRTTTLVVSRDTCVFLSHFPLFWSSEETFIS